MKEATLLLMMTLVAQSFAQETRYFDGDPQNPDNWDVWTVVTGTLEFQLLEEKTGFPNYSAEAVTLSKDAQESFWRRNSQQIQSAPLRPFTQKHFWSPAPDWPNIKLAYKPTYRIYALWLSPYDPPSSVKVWLQGSAGLWANYPNVPLNVNSGIGGEVDILASNYELEATQSEEKLADLPVYNGLAYDEYFPEIEGLVNGTYSKPAQIDGGLNISWGIYSKRVRIQLNGHEVYKADQQDTETVTHTIPYHVSASWWESDELNATRSYQAAKRKPCEISWSGLDNTAFWVVGVPYIESQTVIANEYVTTNPDPFPKRTFAYTSYVPSSGDDGEYKWNNGAFQSAIPIPSYVEQKIPGDANRCSILATGEETRTRNFFDPEFSTIEFSFRWNDGGTSKSTRNVQYVDSYVERESLVPIDRARIDRLPLTLFERQQALTHEALLAPPTFLWSHFSTVLGASADAAGLLEYARVGTAKIAWVAAMCGLGSAVTSYMPDAPTLSYPFARSQATSQNHMWFMSDGSWHKYHMGRRVSCFHNGYSQTALCRGLAIDSFDWSVDARPCDRLVMTPVERYDECGYIDTTIRWEAYDQSLYSAPKLFRLYERFSGSGGGGTGGAI